MEAISVLRRNRWLPLGIVVAGLLAFGAVGLFTADAEEDDVAAPAVAELEPIAGTDLRSVTLTASAAERVGIETALVVDADASGGGSAVPYGAVLYDTEGRAWVYVATEPLEFVRWEIVIDRIDGDQVVISEGPPPGTAVVTVGAAELYGTELEVDH
jgi:hypothetical protein